MLKKNPNCVETMKRLRKYVGNTKAWDMSDEERIKFDFYAQQIRTKAEQIYNQFKVGVAKKAQVHTFGQLPIWISGRKLFFCAYFALTRFVAAFILGHA